MAWTESVLDRLQQQPIGGYHEGKLAATEPTALVALALFAHGRLESAQKGADWLVGCQAMNGSVGVRFGETLPRWPTSLVVMAWAALDSQSRASEQKYRAPILLAKNWIFSFRGEAVKQDAEMGHNTSIVAWPWVEGTHSWIEPTALCTLALKVTGEGMHARTRDAVRCLIDRQLSTGGCNYGNTTVLGQELRPHLQPTGLAMLALTGETDVGGKISRSLRFLESSLNDDTTTASLSFGLMGLAAHGRTPSNASSLLEKSYERAVKREASPYQLALLSLAALGERSPIITMAQTASGHEKASP